MALGRILRDHRQRARARRRDDALEPGIVRQVEQDAGERRIVLDDQHEGLLAQVAAVVGRSTTGPAGQAARFVGARASDAPGAAGGVVAARRA